MTGVGARKGVDRFSGSRSSAGMMRVWLLGLGRAWVCWLRGRLWHSGVLGLFAFFSCFLLRPPRVL